MSIHPTAIISKEADISPDAEIGPYCVISGAVEIGSRTLVESNVRLGSNYGKLIIGADNYIQSGASLGGPPQDWSYKEGYTQLIIGDNNRIAEGVSINLGSQKGGGITRVGNGTFIMANTHIAHDCQIGDEVVLTSQVALAGHVTIERKVTVSGHAGVTQFVRLGELSFLAGGARANKDILPYTIAEGHWAVPRAVNKVGLKRSGLSLQERRNIERAVRILLNRSLTIEQALEAISAECEPDARVEHLTAFVTCSDRGIARG